MSNSPQAANSLFEHFLAVGDELKITRRAEYGTGLRETAPLPLPDEAYEWEALLDAVEEAGRSFTMLELGAGYGRWTVRAAAALRHYRRRVRYHFVAVEAEPTHFQWLTQHTRDNHVSRWSLAGTCRLVNAAVSGGKGEEAFYAGNADRWYGQALVRPENEGADAQTIVVETVTLSELLRPLRRVDLIDIDVQGAELEILDEAKPMLDRVRRIYVETHSDEIAETLHRVFAAAAGNWELAVEVPLNAQRATPLGDARFDGGGAQIWINR